MGPSEDRRKCCSTYQRLHGAVQSVSVVAAELGVNTLEGGVTVGLRLLDTVEKEDISASSSHLLMSIHLSPVEEPKKSR